MSDSRSSSPDLSDDCERVRENLRDSLARARLLLCHVETLLIALALLKSLPSVPATLAPHPSPRAASKHGGPHVSHDGDDGADPHPRIEAPDDPSS